MKIFKLSSSEYTTYSTNTFFYASTKEVARKLAGEIFDTMVSESERLLEYENKKELLKEVFNKEWDDLYLEKSKDMKLMYGRKEDRIISKDTYVDKKIIESIGYTPSHYFKYNDSHYYCLGLGDISDFEIISLSKEDTIDRWLNEYLSELELDVVCNISEVNGD